MADSGIAVTVAASPRGGAWVVNANGAIFELPSGEMRVWIGTSR
jgi:hypothetical protein